MLQLNEQQLDGEMFQYSSLEGIPSVATVIFDFTAQSGVCYKISKLTLVVCCEGRVHVHDIILFFLIVYF